MRELSSSLQGFREDGMGYISISTKIDMDFAGFNPVEPQVVIMIL